MSDDTPGSWNATLSRGPKARTVRKSPEGSSNVVDSGFSTEAKDVSSGASTLGSPSAASNGLGGTGSKMVLSGQSHPPALDVRWDTWESGVPGITAAAPSSAAAAASVATTSGEDELLHLLDVIHRKTVRLRREFESKVSARGGTASMNEGRKEFGLPNN